MIPSILIPKLLGIIGIAHYDLTAIAFKQDVLCFQVPFKSKVVISCKKIVKIERF